MTNVAEKSKKNRPHLLDKLEQLAPTSVDAGFSDLAKLKKRAKAKWFTMGYLKPLVELKSPLHKQYISSLSCTHDLCQKGNKITAKYCGYRWCIVCNRIRIGRAINGYHEPLKQLSDPQFVTLTIPNVIGGDLRASIHKMIQAWQAISKKLRKYSKMTMKGIRKLECTYNPEEDTFHPHFHFIIDGSEQAQELVNEWLQRFPTAERWCQHIKKADEGSMLELFKYFTKVISSKGMYIPALDTIFQAMAGLRVFQPCGIAKVSEEVDELIAENIIGLEERETFWKWLNFDWVEVDTNRSLTGFKPNQKMIELMKNIHFG